jgi:Protein of unknown function (DUF3667)
LTQAETAQAARATCGNCGATTGGAYCPVCGQDTKLEPPTVAEYFHELLDHFAHLDGKLWRTLGALFFLPGKLPQDYLANKRARYVKPLKFYLSAIAIAFAAGKFLGWDLGLKFGGPGFDLSFYLFQQAPPDTGVAQGRVSADTIPWVLEHVDTAGIRHLTALSPEEQLKVTRERGLHYLPYLALGLVPIYVVLLQWMYRDRRRRYGADLVFALYVHSFFLLIFVIEAKLPLALATMLSLWAIVYYVLALKRVYGGTWTGTVGRGALLTILYFLTILIVGLFVTAMMLSL